jgi:hypothetical protein
MIPEAEIKKLVDKLDTDRIIKFFRKNATNTVYFHHLVEEGDNASEVDSDSIQDRELQVPTLVMEEDSFLLVHNNQKLSQTLAKDDFQVASIAVNKLLDLAQSLDGVNGIAVQCNSCYFTVDLDELRDGLV